MDDYKTFFKDKKITLMGLGLLGRGVGDAAFLASCGAELIVTDLKPESELEPSLEKLKSYTGIKYFLGGHREKDFRGRDLIIKAPKTPTNSPYIETARKEGTPITMSSALFAKLSPAKIVGITGTRGKSTVAHLLFEILRHAGRHVILGGNVLGVSTLALLPEVTKETTAVLELDSWQLQGFAEEEISPAVAIFTTFYPDHLDYYKDGLDLYLADKANIFLFQKKGDTLIVGSQAMQTIKEKYGPLVLSRVLEAGEESVPKDFNLVLIGKHNRYDAGCAIKAAEALGVESTIVKEAVERFKGVPGRLEKIAEKKGVSVYNDTTATTPEATIAALLALKGGGNIILIAGGTDKGLALGPLSSAIKENAKGVILLNGSGTEKLTPLLSGVSYSEFDTLALAVELAYMEAEEGDTILFSPAFASFELFKNEYDRGKQFNDLIDAL